MRQWFQSLVPRERLLVIAAAVVTAAALFFLLIWEPLVQANERLTQQVVSAEELNNWLAGVEQQAQALRRSGRSQPIQGRNQSLLSLVDKTSRDAGLGGAVKRIQPEGGDQAVVTLEAAGFNTMLFWLRDLETDYAIRATAITITREDTAGQVQARMTLKRDAA